MGCERPSSIARRVSRRAVLVVEWWCWRSEQRKRRPTAAAYHTPIHLPSAHVPIASRIVAPTAAIKVHRFSRSIRLYYLTRDNLEIVSGTAAAIRQGVASKLIPDAAVHDFKFVCL